MTRIVFIRHLASILMETEIALTPETELDSLPGWDSMGQVAFIAFLDESLGCHPAPGAVARCRKVRELIELAENRIEG